VGHFRHRKALVDCKLESKGRFALTFVMSCLGVEGLSDENTFAFGASHNGTLKANRRQKRLADAMENSGDMSPYINRFLFVRPIRSCLQRSFIQSKLTAKSNLPGRELPDRNGSRMARHAERISLKSLAGSYNIPAEN
jgi:hypothetical protein